MTKQRLENCIPIFFTEVRDVSSCRFMTQSSASQNNRAFTSSTLLVNTFKYSPLKLQPSIRLQLNCGDKICQTGGKAPQVSAAALEAFTERDEWGVRKQTNKKLDKRAMFC